MPIRQLLSHLNDCRGRLTDLRRQQDHIALSCAILRLEGTGVNILEDQPFFQILNGRTFHSVLTVSHGETFALAFYPVTDAIDETRIVAALAQVEAVARKIHPLLADLPEAVRERLQLPDRDNWWRNVFHLGWHFPRTFLSPTRCRVMAREGKFSGILEETFAQMYGTGGQSDLLPGLIFSNFQDNDDLCTCSETAIGIIIDEMERHVATTKTSPSSLSVDKMREFDQLRADFLSGTEVPPVVASQECKLLKLANSFGTPPATVWANLEMGGCEERFLKLSRLNDLQEIVQIRGMATKWFCEVAERAGNALPPWVGDMPIMFDDAQQGFAGPRPVMNRSAVERWAGFVFSTIKHYSPGSLIIQWKTTMGPLGHGLGTLDRDLFSASVLAIDLAKLTTAAKDASDKERANCSPFSVPSMEEQGFQWVQEMPVTPASSERYTLGQMIEDLRRFGENYCGTADQIRDQIPAPQKASRLQLGSFVSGERGRLNGKIGFAELSEFARAQWSTEMSFAISRRIAEALVEKSRGGLTAIAAESLSLPEAVSFLNAPESTMIGAETSSQDNESKRGEPMVATFSPLQSGTAVAPRDKVFISYSHKDKKFLDALLDHLKPYTRAGVVSKWSDKQIAPGSKWFAEIQAALARSKVAVMLVSSSFLASDFIHEHELGPLLKEAEKGGVRILWIPIRACSYKETPLKDYQAVCDPDKPLAVMKAERDKAWVEICDAIKKALHP